MQIAEAVEAKGIKELKILNQFPSYFIDFMVIPAKHGQDVQTRWV
jgi:hypothetical protein